MVSYTGDLAALQPVIFHLGNTAQQKELKVAETLKNAMLLTEYYYEADIPTYWHGPPGVGKSQGFKQLAAHLGKKHGKKFGFKDLR